ncbi:hypothetical protein CWO89_36375 [Bradyrhizobium sp. Leo170]|nr:hypothetical protein CWO89_36375 [Bradyrhizobium sp. Leo170]
MPTKFESDYTDFNTPITGLGADASKLTTAASKLLEGDLIALSWGNHTTRTESLTVRDIQSIEEAFAAHPFHGDSRSGLVGAPPCCCCTAPCCCTAGAVVDTSGTTVGLPA